MKGRPKKVNNITKPAPVKKKQEAEGSTVFTSTGLKWVIPAINTTLIEQYAENALLAEPLKNIKDLIFTTYEDHPSPWVTIKDPKGNIDDLLSDQGQQIAKTCDFYNAHIRALMDQELGGCSVWSPGWGTIDGVTGICPVELRNLPWNSFRDTPPGFVDVYNDIMPGIVIDKSTGQVRIWQKEDDRSTAKEVQNFLIVRDPTTPYPAGKPGCLPVLTFITNYNYADKAWNQKMNRVAAPSIFPYVERITAANKDYVEALAKKWGKDTCFILTAGMDFKDPKLVESSTAEERLAWLKKRIDGFYNPATFLQKDGNTIGGSDSGSLRLVNNMVVATLARLENSLGEKLLQQWLDINGFVGYSAECRYPRPETTDDAQVLAEITEANKNGQISRMEARQKYPNLDLPELTPEEEAKMDAEYAARKPTPPQFGFGQIPSQEPGQPVGNLQQMPVSQTERDLIAATRQCKKDVLRIVKGKIAEQKPGILQTIKNVFAPVNNAGGDIEWITVNGQHIPIQPGQSKGDAVQQAIENKGGSSGYGSFGDESKGHESIRSVEKSIVTKSKEEAHFHDKNGNKILSKQGEDSEVGGFTESEFKSLKGTIGTHNHPAIEGIKAPRTLSPEDYSFTAHADLAEMHAVTADRTYIFKRGAEGWPDPVATKTALMKNVIAAVPKFTADVKSGKLKIIDAETKIYTSAWTTTSKEMGFGFSVRAT